MQYPFLRLHRRALELWARARSEHSTPREIGWSVAVGAFVACTPLIGLHVWLALALATLLRLNRLWTCIGSRLSSTPVLVVTTFCEIEAAHRLRTGRWAAMEWREALQHGRELILDWVVGTVIVGGLIATCVGLLAYGIARRLQAPTLRTPERLPAPSSESPTSEPPNPMP